MRRQTIIGTCQRGTEVVWIGPPGSRYSLPDKKNNNFQPQKTTSVCYNIIHSVRHDIFSSIVAGFPIAQYTTGIIIHRPIFQYAYVFFSISKYNKLFVNALFFNNNIITGCELNSTFRFSFDAFVDFYFIIIICRCIYLFIHSFRAFFFRLNLMMMMTMVGNALENRSQ